MKKGDCIILNDNETYYALILHHSIDKNDKIEYRFVIVGETFKKEPLKLEIELSGLLGYKYQNDTADLINSAMRSRQKFDRSTFYTGVKYDLISIPKSFFDERKTTIKKVASLKINPKFYPLPNFQSRLDDFDQICELIRTRISERDPKKIEWSTIYDAYPLREILEN